jgi:hypothetical protein
MCSTLEKVPWAAEKNVCSAAVEWNTLSMSVEFIGPVVQFNSQDS